MLTFLFEKFFPKPQTQECIWVWALYSRKNCLPYHTGILTGKLQVNRASSWETSWHNWKHKKKMTGSTGSACFPIFAS